MTLHPKRKPFPLFSPFQHMRSENPWHRMLGVGLLFVVMLFLGSLGFVLLTGASWFESLYLTFISITTVGYGETIPLGTGGRLWAMAVILSGLVFLGYTVSIIVHIVVNGELRSHWEAHRMVQNVNRLVGHVVVCGSGRTGRAVSLQLCRKNVPHVVVDTNPEKFERLYHLLTLQHPKWDQGERAVHTLLGDATSDELMEMAGVNKAQVLVAAAGDDMTNLFVTLTARNLNPKLHIVARVTDQGNERKLKLAGASEIICVYTIGGEKMSDLALAARDPSRGR